jgi:hypothetical protein
MTGFMLSDSLQWTGYSGWFWSFGDEEKAVEISADEQKFAQSSRHR